MASKSVDLGKAIEADESNVHYPCLYLNDVPELDDLPDDLFKFEGVGKLISHTEKIDPDGTRHCSCEIEVHSIEPMGDNKPTDLGKALDKIASDKMDDDDEESEEY